MKDRLLALGRIALGGLFLYAASTKIPDMAAFASEIANYRAFPPPAIPLLGAWVVGLELLVGLALALGIAARGAAAVTSGLLLVFIAVLSQALLRGIDLQCGCFGGTEPASWATVGRDAVMLAGAVTVAVRGPGRLLAPRRER